MSTLSKQEFSREQRLFEARKLSKSITKKTSAAGLTEARIKNDAQAAFIEMKDIFSHNHHLNKGDFKIES